MTAFTEDNLTKAQRGRSNSHFLTNSRPCVLICWGGRRPRLSIVVNLYCPFSVSVSLRIEHEWHPNDILRRWIYFRF